MFERNGQRVGSLRSFKRPVNADEVQPEPEQPEEKAETSKRKASKSSPTPNDVFGKKGDSDG